MSAMQHAAQDYLALRRSLGYRLEAPGRLISDFARYLDGLGLAHVTVDAALSWATSPGGSPYWHWFRLSAVRGFAGYLHAFDDRHQVPPADLLARRYQRPVPFLFTSADIAALMDAAAARPARLHALNCRTLIGLLAVTGMRPGEAYALDREHVDLAAGRLSVINGKYGKSRELALHPSSVIALQEYAEHRDYLCPRPAAPGFFVSMSGERLHQSNTDTAFRRLVGRAGLQPRSARSTALPQEPPALLRGQHPDRLVPRREGRQRAAAAAVHLARARRAKLNVLVPAGHPGTARAGRRPAQFRRGQRSGKESRP